MKKIFTSVMAMAFAMTMSAQVTTASEAIAVTSGFNQDVIVAKNGDDIEAVPQFSESYKALDYNGSSFASQAVVDYYCSAKLPAETGTGLPNDGAITLENGHKYQLGDYLSNNCLYLEGNGKSGTLTLSKNIGTNFNKIGLLLTGGNRDSGNYSFKVTFKYADDTEEVVENLSVTDWCETNNDVVVATHRYCPRHSTTYADPQFEKVECGLAERVIDIPSQKEVKAIVIENVSADQQWGPLCLGVYAVSAIKEVNNLYVLGDISTNGWSNGENPATPDAMTWNAETQAFEFAFTAKGDSYFAISDIAEPTTWGDFNANNRYAIKADANAEATLGEAIQLVRSSAAIKVSGAGKYLISIDKTLKMTVTKTADVEVTTAYYLVGNMTEWKATDAYKLTKNEAAEGEEYSITVDLAADAQFKIVAADEEKTITTWYPDNAGNYGANGEMQGAGTYTVYFRPNADGGEGWFNGVIYAVNTTGINNIAAETLKTAVIYNINGQRVSQPSRGLYIMNGRKVAIK